VRAVCEEVAPSSTDEADGGGRVTAAAFLKGGHNLPFTEGQPRLDSCQALRFFCSTCGFAKGVREGEAPRCQTASLAVADMHVQLCLLILMLVVFRVVSERSHVIIFPHAYLEFEHGREHVHGICLAL
jgi:hypothetical protein